MSRRKGRRSRAKRTGNPPEPGRQSPDPDGRVRTIEASYSGPLPLAAELRRYDATVPGSAERIVRMAESHAQHRQAMERESLAATAAEKRRGQWLGAGIVMLVLGVCLVALYRGQETFASELGTWTVISLAVVFVLGRIPWLRDRTGVLE